MTPDVEQMKAALSPAPGIELPSVPVAPGPTTPPLRPPAAGQREEADRPASQTGAAESALSSGLQILFPFLLAGLGMVGAGLLLDRVVEWEVFRSVRELCILVPPLLGLKGNLEMTLASRLSSHAALGDLDTRACGVPLVAANLALIQCQGLVLGCLASGVAALMSHTVGAGLSYEHFVLLCSSAMSTASIASFLIGLLMAAVVVGARKCGVNPDNIAAPVAAALGDLITLALLASSAEVFWRYQGSGLASGLIAGYLLLAVFCACYVMKNPQTAPVLYTGWIPIICSLCISSLGGMILDKASAVFPRIHSFQPVINGAGGNLAAVQASRMATHLHSRAQPGDLREDEDTCRAVWPSSVFSSPSRHSQTARVLMALVVPGHLVFLWAICTTQGYAASDLGLGFFVFYLLGALVQEWLLLYVCVHLVHFQWRIGVDPDSAAVPILTAIGDLCGAVLLAGDFAAMARRQPSPPPPHAAVQPHGGRLADAASGAAMACGSRGCGLLQTTMSAHQQPPSPRLPVTVAAFAALRALRAPFRSRAGRALRRR